MGLASARKKKIHGQKDRLARRNTSKENTSHIHALFPINYQPSHVFVVIFLKPAEARGLRREAVGLRVGSWRGWLSGWALREHQAGAAEDRGVVLLLDLRLLARVALVVVLLEDLDCRRLLGQEVDHEWHREIGKAVAP